LTDQVHGQVDEYFPMRSLYFSKTTGKFTCDASEKDELEELAPYTRALAKLVG
jgi:hypothetical protein